MFYRLTLDQKLRERMKIGRVTVPVVCSMGNYYIHMLREASDSPDASVQTDGSRSISDIEHCLGTYFGMSVRIEGQGIGN